MTRARIAATLVALALASAATPGTGPTYALTPAPVCLSADGIIPAGHDVCVWPPPDDIGTPFIASGRMADGAPETVDRSWSGAAEVYESRPARP